MISGPTRFVSTRARSSLFMPLTLPHPPDADPVYVRSLVHRAHLTRSPRDVLMAFLFRPSLEAQSGASGARELEAVASGDASSAPALRSPAASSDGNRPHIASIDALRAEYLAPRRFFVRLLLRSVRFFIVGAVVLIVSVMTTELATEVLKAYAGARRLALAPQLCPRQSFSFSSCSSCSSSSSSSSSLLFFPPSNRTISPACGGNLRRVAAAHRKR